jgi:hypothetical protein
MSSFHSTLNVHDEPTLVELVEVPEYVGAAEAFFPVIWYYCYRSDDDQNDYYDGGYFGFGVHRRKLGLNGK